jgi:hypothetical protein
MGIIINRFRWPIKRRHLARDDFYLYIKETDRRNGTDFTKIFPEIAYFYENAGKYYEEARAKWEEDQKSAEPVAHVEEINSPINDAEG